MSFCELIKKIAEDPKVKMEVHLGHAITVREMFEIRSHVYSCDNCQNVLDKINEKYSPKPDFYKGELN
jgi:hypothetical protein